MGSDASACLQSQQGHSQSDGNLGQLGTARRGKSTRVALQCPHVAGSQELHFTTHMGRPQAILLPLQSRLETAEMQLADVTAALERLQSEHKRLQVGTCLPRMCCCRKQRAAALSTAGNVRGCGLLQS